MNDFDSPIGSSTTTFDTGTTQPAPDLLQAAPEASEVNSGFRSKPKMSFSNPDEVARHLRSERSARSSASAKAADAEDEVDRGEILDRISWRVDAADKNAQRLHADRMAAYMDMTMQMKQQALEMEQRKSDALARKRMSRRPIPLWRYFTYAAPKGMQLNPDRDRTRDFLYDNASRIVWGLVPSALFGWGFSMFLQFVGGMFVEFPDLVAENLWIACALVIYANHWSVHLDMSGRRLGHDTSRYIPIPDALPESKPEPTVANRRPLEKLADATPSGELRKALIDMEQLLSRWEHFGASGVTNKRHDHVIRTLVDACTRMYQDRDLMNSAVDQEELLETLRTANASLREVLDKDVERKSNDFGGSLRALRSQIAGGKRKD